MNQLATLSTRLDFEDNSILIMDGTEEITRSPSFTLGHAIHLESRLRRAIKTAECSCGTPATRLLDIEFEPVVVVALCEDCYSESLSETWAELGLDR